MIGLGEFCIHLPQDVSPSGRRRLRLLGGRASQAFLSLALLLGVLLSFPTASTGFVGHPFARARVEQVPVTGMDMLE